jgi:hypothetical protein
MLKKYFHHSMKLKSFKVYIVSALWIAGISGYLLAQDQKNNTIPCLRKQGTAIQLIVDDKPFLILAGELGNSSASSPEYMEAAWDKIVIMNLNTVLAPVYWELVEPQEGKFDFALVDSLIYSARQHKLHLILLWFGSWKNSMSCYVPFWIKTNQERFPRARTRAGKPMEILSVFSEENRDADRRAFTALMRHIRDIDANDHTVIMIQVENEVGMLEDARDWSPAANALFIRGVPQELTEYLQKNRESLMPELKDRWRKNSYKTSGTWEELFGKGLATDEFFMAWYYARYINDIAAAGKAEYSLPMFVNAALIRPGYQPGEYPSAGPLPHLMDIWKAGAPQIDFLAPDIYFPNFAEWCQKYDQSGNPLFIPEATRDINAAVKVLYAIGQHDAIGFSPFSIESTNDPENDPIRLSYDVLSQLSPLILEKQGKGEMVAIILDEQNQNKQLLLGNYILTVMHDYTFQWAHRSEESHVWPLAGGIIIMLTPDEYLIAGNGIIVTFEPNQEGDKIAGIASIDEGRYLDGCWIPARRLNGDQSHQGRHLRLPNGQFGMQRVKLYTYH